MDPSLCLPNEQKVLTKTVINDHCSLFAVFVAESHSKITVVIHNSLLFDRIDRMDIFKPLDSSNSLPVLFLHCRELCTSREMVFSFEFPLNR